MKQKKTRILKVNKVKLIVAGGGTGGHIFPAVAIANAVRKASPDTEVLFVGAKGKMEMEKVPKEGYRIIGLDIAGFDRNSMLKNLSLPFKLIKSFIQAGKILKEFKPSVVVGVGGYASFPVLYMAQRKGIPTLIQEQNSHAGKSNQQLGKKAKAICVAYEGMDKFFPKDKIILTGNPIRASISTNEISKEKGIEKFGLNSTKKIVFAFGGSLGAKSINETLADQFKEVIASDAQLLWQTGTSFFEKAKEAVKGYESQVKVFEFIQEMDYAYAAADVIISRAGASSISELCIVGKPVVFVPFPYASEDHQTSNAMALVKINAALMVKDHETKSDLLAKVKSLLYDTTQQELIKKNISTLAIQHADENIASKIIEMCN
ncbi:MAG: undecaprenyldiphospho-muramoylpentapeptide beta-N-acetylglucosaminyltransferase [Chitinophagaceae bacterium]|nr:undecaprenyldiphospho-muramoylpentapeptide beta-N-acetylglucosaminyltransferase [Chitinophagaceae bacterium]